MFSSKWNDALENPDYCGYCKCEPCECDGHGGANTPTCGYCHEAYDEQGNCLCDGFGNSPKE